MSPTGWLADLPIGLVFAVAGGWLLFYNFIRDNTEEIERRSRSRLEVAVRTSVSVNYILTVGLYIWLSTTVLFLKFPPNNIFQVVVLALAGAAFLVFARLFCYIIGRTPAPVLIAGIALTLFGLAIELVAFFAA